MLPKLFATYRNVNVAATIRSVAAQNDTPSVGSQLAALMADKRMSGRKLANLTGLDPSYISKLKRNQVKNPRKHISAVEAALGVKRGHIKFPVTEPGETDDDLLRLVLRRLRSLEKKLDDAAQDAATSFAGLAAAIDALSEAPPAAERQSRR